MIHIHSINEVKRLAPRVRRDISALIEEVHRLNMLLKPVLVFPQSWGLGNRESQLLAALYAGGDSPVSMARLIHAIYGDDEPEFVNDCVKVFMYRLRKKLRAHNVRILCVSCVGWYLDAWSREFVRKAIEGKSK